jgi:hypothetical protein
MNTHLGVENGPDSYTMTSGWNDGTEDTNVKRNRQSLRASIRHSWPQSQAWNRQSIQIFADFNDFESPRGSQSQRAAECEDEEAEAAEAAAATGAEVIFSSGRTHSFDSLNKPLPEPPYHIFTLAKKKQLVYIVSAAAIFSPLSSNIYFPALGAISNVSI